MSFKIYFMPYTRTYAISKVASGVSMSVAVTAGYGIEPVNLPPTAWLSTR